MALKLGELLIKERMITPEQLEEGLKNQVIYGIRLGSSLVEMGYVDADALAQLLSRKLAVPSVSKKDLAAIPKELIAAFPRSLVEQYRVIPFYLEGNRLWLAMADPTDLKALEEIAFITGHVVQPFIAPDVHISRALAKYYRISSGEMRYQMIADKHRPKDSVQSAETPTITMPGYTESGELLQMTIPVEFEGFASLPECDVDFDDNSYADGGRYTVDRLSLDFASAHSRDDVANVFITYLGQEFATGALLIVRGNSALGWRAVSSCEPIERFADFTILLSKPSVLRDVLESRAFVMGTLIATAENRQLLSTLKIRPETPLLVVPVIMLNKVVAILVVSAEMDSLSRRLVELQKLVRKASLAFEMLIIRNKILVT